MTIRLSQICSVGDACHHDIITFFKPYRKKETITRIETANVAGIIQKGVLEKEVRRTRSLYGVMHTKREPDGQISCNIENGIRLPRVCFAAEFANRSKNRRMISYNGLVVIELNNLKSYDEAIAIREKAKRMPFTMMTFLGGSGRSVKIVCRGGLAQDFTAGPETPTLQLPSDEASIRQFHRNLYEMARKAYEGQLNRQIEAMEPLLERTVYLSADPAIGFNPNATPFFVDANRPQEEPAMKDLSPEESQLMPGRSMVRTWRMNWLFIIEEVLGKYFDLPDEERQETLLMQVATRCLNEGIPMAKAQQMTLEHPALNTDELLVTKTFSAVYAVTHQKDYMKKHKIRPLQSIPEDTLLMMRTEIFLNTNFEMRKNVMTGVAQYREKTSIDPEFHDLDQEVRNDMTIRAKELGLKSWDKDIDRFIDSSRIDKFYPLNDWLMSLPRWDGRDRVAELAARVPTNQPHWEMYLHRWLLAMVAQWREDIGDQLTGNALVPLLIGRQGCGKTRFCGILMPPELRMYYNKEINFKKDTDLNLGLSQFGLINLDEFDKTTNRQQVILKYLLSTGDVKFRPPYGKAIRQYKRYASFIGTTNQMKPLVDPTGSRRFVCVECTGDINFDDNLDHWQLYAQLMQELGEGQRYWLDDEEIAVLMEENSRFERTADLVEMIAATFRKPSDPKGGRLWTLQEVSDLLSSRYRNYDPSTTFEKLGRTLSNQPFAFVNERSVNCSRYRMEEM